MLATMEGAGGARSCPSLDMAQRGLRALPALGSGKARGAAHRPGLGSFPVPPRDLPVPWGRALLLLFDLRPVTLGTCEPLQTAFLTWKDRLASIPPSAPPPPGRFED